MADNYKDIDWLDLEAISIYERENEMRRTSKIIGDDHVCQMVQQQLEIAKSLGFKKAFISRCRSPRHLRKLVMAIGEKTKTEWNMLDDKVAVCDPKHDECWQYKAVTELC